MCGIAGWYRRGGKPVPTGAVERQIAAIRHRGPDDCGIHADGDLAMGMRRLSIVDLPGGHQPMRSSCGRFHIVYNGEVYNHAALRAELTAAGYRFATRSDTEVVLAGWITWGNSAWTRFDGMYAVAIWDSARRRLVLARDPLGIKPLYLTRQNGGLAFASEVRALTVLPDHAFSIDDRSVHDFFQFGQIEPPRSIYAQVQSLPAGTMLTIGAHGEARTERFWSPQVGTAPDRRDGEWIEETRERLLAAVESHLRADVPVGTFLSGGVDSSAITAAAARLSASPVTAFTIALPGNRMDEADAAAATARHLGCRHELLPVDLDDSRDMVPMIQAGFDEPMGTRGGAILSWLLSRHAAGQFKVVLCGDGGDELFAGYKRQRNAMRMDRWRHVMRLLNGGSRLVAGLAGPRAERLREAASLGSGFERFIHGTQISSTAQRSRLLAPEFQAVQERSIASLAREWFDGRGRDQATMLEQFMLGDLLVHMPGGPLARLDRTSMAHSLEARVPLLSLPFAEWALAVPARLKARSPGKYLLREAVRPWLPPGILDRPKQGFQIPLADWFRGDLGRFGLEAWHGSGLATAGYFQPAEVERLFRDHRSGRASHAKTLYAITTFACWWNARRGGRETQAAAERAGASVLV